MAFAIPSTIPSGLSTAQGSFNSVVGDVGGTCDLFGSLGDFLPSLEVGGITRALDDAVGDIEDALKAAVEFGGKVLAAISDGLKVLDALLAQVNAIFELLATEVADAVTAAFATLESAMSGVFSAIGEVMSGLGAAFSALGAAMADGLKKLGAATCGIASQGLSALKGVDAGAAVNAATSALDGGPMAVGSAVMGSNMSGVADSIKNAASAMGSTSTTQTNTVNVQMAAVASQLSAALASV
jgi:hypothetical protein